MDFRVHLFNKSVNCILDDVFPLYKREASHQGTLLYYCVVFCKVYSLHCIALFLLFEQLTSFVTATDGSVEWASSSLIKY